MATRAKKLGKTLNVKVHLNNPPMDFPWDRLAAYLHTRSGRLITKVQLTARGDDSDEGIASIELPKAGAKTMIVKVGPNVEDRRELANKTLVMRRVLITPSDSIESKLELPRETWERWIAVPYVVTGVVEKWQDDTVTPVCVGEVDIFDIDVRCLLRLPDPVIEKIRHSFLDLVVDPPRLDHRFEIPTDFYVDPEDYWCGTPPRPLPWPLFYRNLRDRFMQTAPRMVERLDAAETAGRRVDALMSRMAPPEQRAWLAGDATEGIKVSQLVDTNTEQFRRLLVDRFQHLRYWLCWYPWIYWLWWPHCRPYCRTLLGTATLESDGSFQKTVWLPIYRLDQPDLWFTVRQKIDGAERVVFARYPVLCHTYWNHRSSDPVRLRVTDPEAVACALGGEPDQDGVYVMPLGVGDDGWYDIRYGHLDPPVVLTDYERHAGLYAGTDPYGTRLDLRMQFHDDLRDRGVRYYRWSHRLEGSTPGIWTPIATPITHRHLDRVGSDYFLVSEQLGPKTVGTEPNLFEVPDPDKDWIALNRNDRASAIWHTARRDATTGQYVAQVPNGRHMLRLEMFDAAGTPVVPSSSTFEYFLPAGPSSGGLWPVDTDLNVQADGSIIFRLYVDNADTVADIESVGLDGAATRECQFIEYADRVNDQVAVAFIADHHPGTSRDFIRGYGLSVKRGVSGTGVASASQTFVPSGVVVIPPYDPPGRIVKTFNVDDLLGEAAGRGPFDRCSFAVRLHTYPRTRDGFGTIRAYESSDTSTFALVEDTP